MESERRSAASRRPPAARARARFRASVWASLLSRALSDRRRARARRYFVEAPSLFERNGIYYALFSWCCCFCKQGSGIIVHTAPHPLGPWTVQAVGPSYERGDVACVAKAAGSGDEDALAASPGLGTDPTPGLGCEYKNASETSSTRAQQNSIWVSGRERRACARTVAADSAPLPPRSSLTRRTGQSNTFGSATAGSRAGTAPRGMTRR